MNGSSTSLQYVKNLNGSKSPRTSHRFSNEEKIKKAENKSLSNSTAKNNQKHNSLSNSRSLSPIMNSINSPNEKRKNVLNHQSSTSEPGTKQIYTSGSNVMEKIHEQRSLEIDETVTSTLKK